MTQPQYALALLVPVRIGEEQIEAAVTGLRPTLHSVKASVAHFAFVSGDYADLRHPASLAHFGCLTGN